MKLSKIRELLMGTEEAHRIWGLSQDHIKKLCREGKCEAFQVGKTWILLKNQPNPKRNKENDGRGDEDVGNGN